MSEEEKNIVGYLHICQKNNWERSFDMIINSLKSNGLYEATREIRCGIVSDNESLALNNRFDDPKIKIIFIKHSSQYERPTLLHMRDHANSDPCNTSYWYFHSKGIKHFETHNEPNVVDWINMLLYWNSYRWRLAVKALEIYDLYGANGMIWNDHLHFLGNFWWANSAYIKRLPNTIGDDYLDPEFWCCLAEPNMCNIYTNHLAGGGNYDHRLPSDNYMLPEHFNIDIYKYHNPDLTHFNYQELISHYLQYGKHENRNY